MKPKRYILFKDGQAFDLFGDQIISSFNIVDEEKAESEYGMEKAFIEIYYHDERGSFCEYDGKGGRTMDWWYLDEIAKQADTIEELCDYVFFKDWEGKLQIRKMFGGYKQIKSLLLDGATEIKLAILTDKGLIYVAKMNEEGELELL